ncbi:MAG: DUF2281 domain-containing protein [Candidatus Competibacter denitrificans]|jgi:hypothetical protein
MTLADRIYQHSLHLPEPAAREVLSFIQMLEKRHQVDAAAQRSTDTYPNETEIFLQAVAGTLEADFPDDITDEDLGTDRQQEGMD